MTPAEMFDALPQEMKEEMRRAARERFKDDSKVLEFMSFEEDLCALNDQLCNTLGMMKKILSRFDENGTSADKALGNLQFFGKMMVLVSPSLNNLCENVTKFEHRYKKKGDQNEN